MLDRVLVAGGYTSSSISRGGRSPLRLRILIAALFLLSVLPTIAISLITIPSETSFDDLRAGRYRGLGGCAWRAICAPPPRERTAAT
jgi:hypothetical protein